MSRPRDEQRATGDDRGSQTDRHAELRARLRENMARLSRDPGASMGGGPPRVAIAIAMAVLVFVTFSAGARHRLPGRLNSAILLGPGGSSALPVAAFTPGAVQPLTAAELCAARRPIDRIVTPRIRMAVLRDYQMDTVPPHEYELDYLITPELGGAATRQNLWPERYGSRVWNARVKDQLEQLLPTMVCEGRLELATAQRDIAANWIAAYKKYFHTEVPLHSQLARAGEDEAEGPIVADAFDPAVRFVGLSPIARR